MALQLGKSINTRIYFGYTLMVAIMTISVGLSTYILNNLSDELKEIKNSSQDAMMTARLDIDLTTFNLVFRRYMLTDNNIEEWERAQRVYGGFSATLKEAGETLSHPERQAAGQQIGENAAVIRSGAEQIVDIIQRLEVLDHGALGENLDSVSATITEESQSQFSLDMQSNLAFVGLYQKLYSDIRKTVKTPNDETLATAQASFQQVFSFNQPLAFKETVVPSLEEAQAALAEYVEISKQKNQLVATNLNQMGFQTGGLAEESRIAAMDQQSQLMAMAEQDIQKMVTISLVLLLISVGSGIAAALLISRSIGRPIANINKSMSAIANGNLEETIPETDRGDEIGQMAQATKIFKDNLLHTQQVEEEARAVKEREREAARQKQLELADTFESQMGMVVNELSSSATCMLDLSKDLQCAANKTTDKSVTMAAAAEESSTNVSTVAAAVEEMSAALTAMTSSVGDVSNRASDATSGAKEAENDLDALQSAIAEIIDVIDSINSVADQTNLLALNATIEAARAGDSGKGFAVVASEVKALADQTRKMTEVITERISSVEQTSEQVIQKTRLIVDKIATINESIGGISDSVGQQDAATNEISHAAQDASTGSTSVSSDIQSVQEAAQSMNRNSDEVSQTANQIFENVKQVETQMDRILTSVRSA